MRSKHLPMVHLSAPPERSWSNGELIMAQKVPEFAIRKVALIALTGASIEWYDFFLYGTAAALIFPTKFFSANFSPLMGLLASFSTFAVGFLARPIGAVIFGHYGDRIGRKKVLVIALVMMGLTTASIGVLPTYASVGNLAPVLLITLRFMQGLAIGGQWGGAILLVTETAPSAKRGFYGSFAQVGAPAGIVLSNAAFFVVSASLSAEDFSAWGWRIPFLLSLALIGVALYIHFRLGDTAAFRQLQSLHQTQLDAAAPAPVGQHSPVLDAIRHYPKEIALVAGAFLANQVNFYILATFVVAYGTSPVGLGLSRSTLLSAVVIGSLFMTPAILWSGWLSDRWGGRRGIYMLAAALLCVWSFAIFPLIETRSVPAILLAMVVGQVFIGWMYGPQAALITELFGTNVRYSGASLGYQLGAILGGAFAPVVSTALLAKFGTTFWVAMYMAAASFISLVCVYLLRETQGCALDSASHHIPHASRVNATRAGTQRA
jgi:MFS family permease